MITTIPYTPKALWLFHHGTLALSKVETDGIRIDTEYLQRIKQESQAETNRLMEECRQMDEYKMLVKKFGAQTNIGSDDQVRWLCEELELEIEGRTKTGQMSLSASSLAECDNPFIVARGQIKGMDKAIGTFLKGVENSTDRNGYLHSSFNLHTVNTYRSSSTNPNFQNFPKRKPTMAKLVRTAFIPREEHQLLEVDYGGQEVKLALCYHDDPMMRKYLCEGHGDMHRDVAKEVYMLTDEQMEVGHPNSRPVRDVSKNSGTFPEFYGSYWRDVSRSLWNAIRDRNLMTTQGVSLYKHLRSKGIRELGSGIDRPEPRTFQEHICNWEKMFWNYRFPVYKKWRLDTTASYLKKGYIEYLTGFRVHGILRRNQTFNFPVQGAAFHVLLYSLICLVRELKRRKMRSLCIGQIHDSMVCDVYCDELEEFKELLNECMLVKTREFYPWTAQTPLEIDLSIAPPGGSWWDCK